MHVVIIGNGITGITAARNIRKKSDCRISVISSETEHFFSRTAIMYVYMGHLKYGHTKPYEDFFWKKNRIELVYDHVERIRFDEKSLELKSGSELAYDKLLIATGSKPNMFGWPGQELRGVQGLYSYQDLELLEKNTHPPLARDQRKKVQRAVIVGGGLIGIELAEMLSSRDIDVTILVRERRFWGNVLPEEESGVVMEHMEDHGIRLMCGCEAEEMLPDEDGRVRAVRTKSGDEIACEFVGLTAGVSPNIEFLKNSALNTARGVLVNLNLETSIPDVYAAGDCAEIVSPKPGRKSIEQVWYTGKMMGETAAENILGNRVDYDPGPWFNSAKFFDIEYQTYGVVNAELRNDENSFYWENQQGDKCMKVITEKETGIFRGINMLGIRMRHELFDRWLRQGWSTDDVMAHLNDALFDPEFYRNYSEDVIGKYNLESGKNIRLKKRSRASIFAI